MTSISDELLTALNLVHYGPVSAEQQYFNKADVYMFACPIYVLYRAFVVLDL